jgi:hypothetical protein
MGTSIDRKRRLSAADFLEALEARLTSWKPPELRAILMLHAEMLPAVERGAFLAIFEKVDEAGKTQGKGRAGRATDAQKLLRDIGALVDQYGGERHEGQEDDWGDAGEEDDWDHDEPAHATWPTAKLDALFDRADASPGTPKAATPPHGRSPAILAVLRFHPRAGQDHPALTAPPFFIRSTPALVIRIGSRSLSAAASPKWEREQWGKRSLFQEGFRVQFAASCPRSSGRSAPHARRYGPSGAARRRELSSKKRSNSRLPPTSPKSA